MVEEEKQDRCPAIEECEENVTEDKSETSACQKTTNYVLPIKSNTERKRSLENG